MNLKRRDFLKTTTASTLAAPFILNGQKAKMYKTAVIGAGWWGMNIAGAALASRQCKITALCDVDDHQLAVAQEKMRPLTSDVARQYKDYRELLQKEKPEIVIVATPDHWHALPTIAAIEAGADVYVEKPICHTIYEGRAMVKAAREHERVVQVGLHRRTSPHNMSAIQFLKQGGAGEIGMIRSFVHHDGGPGRATPDSEIPAGLDWDFWCGPAPYRPYNSKIHPRGFRSFLDFANGQLGDWGIHWLDHILWWTEEKYPKSVHSVAARHILQDNTEAPDTQVVHFEFQDFIATWESRRYGGNAAEKHELGIYFYGTLGTVHIGWHDGWTFYPVRNGAIVHEPPQLHEPDQQNIPELWANFLTCIESREKPICDIEIGHRSTTMSLLGMLSAKVGRSIAWDGEQQIILHDPEANQYLKRDYRAPWSYPL
ncbi:Gfo/Idh/MocA family oxidoreductase [candidate division KSB1 bacterium]|nr:Gfo/Idh/MocA family oxidoreductase [candidate division KSB1 bacterium]RQW08156.1 MAG: gfo/Idh/MocA family oxidoreductase [candidate division KSB1 bacterium]